MAIPFPSDFARAFGFRLDGAAVPLLPFAQMEATLEKEFVAFVRSPKNSFDQIGVFVAEFNSQYFPSLMRTLLNERLGPTHFLQLAQAFTGHAGSYFARFTRIFPREAQKLYPAFANAIAVVHDELLYVLMEREPNGRTFVISNLESFLNVVIILASDVPPGSFLPPLPPSAKNALLHLASMGADESKLGAAWVERVGEGGILVEALRLLAYGERDPQKLAQAFEDRRWSIVWWECEHPHERGTEHEGSCSYPTEGEEMKACSRCLSVRYCSKAHQKADWKRHKLLCFKPNW